MNIFFLSFNVEQCAEWMVDRHVVKMILEYCQLLCTAHRVLDGSLHTELTAKQRRMKRYMLSDAAYQARLYKATHINHPCAVWVRASSGNYEWLVSLFAACLHEYSYRYNKQHACAALLPLLSKCPHALPTGPFKEPPLAMPEAYKVAGCEASYRRYYTAGKAHLFAWKRRQPPSWIAAEEAAVSSQSQVAGSPTAFS